jgi:diguanylate cyclase (GGDEF)-like protein
LNQEAGMTNENPARGENRCAALEPEKDERDIDRLRMTTPPDVMRVELVSAFAGDRVMSEPESAFMKAVREKRGDVFYSDLLYAISHHYFAPEIAKPLWEKVLTHKLLISEKLGRNVRIAVATLDYFSNITAEMSSATLISESHVSELTDLSMRDGMTGLFNHTSCYELLDLEFRRNRRHGIGVSVILLDIDDFKSVNDRGGHQEGDRILIELAAALTEEVREMDICCRFGGEEFVAILPFANDPDEACAIAERIRTRVASISSSGGRITVSIGVAVCDGATGTPRALIERADRALYQAKTTGKNRVVLGCVEN